MGLLGSSVAQSVAGLNQAERIQAREAKGKDKKSRLEKREKAQDELDLEIEQVEHIDAVRNLKGNEQEESHEDRDEHLTYGPNGHAKKKQERQLDLEG